MSWDVYVSSDKNHPEPIDVECHSGGGTYAVDGVPSAELNVTYNYSREFRKALGRGFRDLHGKHVKDILPLLKEAVKTLGTEQDSDYWKATPGNAGHALNILAGWCRQAIDGGQDAWLLIF